MEIVQRIHKIEQLKILGDPRRLAILQMLMSEPGTLSSLGKALGEHPARVRHHLKQLEQAGLVELVETRTVRGFVEKYYRARARAFLIQQTLLPKDQERETVFIVGSHDLALEALVRQLNQAGRQGGELLLLPVGSLEGLMYLRQGLGSLSGSHLLDAQSGEYNAPFVSHIFPDRSMTLVTLAHRQQGLIVPPGNPRGLRGIEDLGREDLAIVNRNRGSGTRLWLDGQLQALGIPFEAVRGYYHEATTHTEVARAVRQGRVDCGVGLQSAARLFDLDFVPLFQERFDLVLPKEQLSNRALQPLFDALQSGEFRRILEGLEGYDARQTGAQKDIG